MISFFILIENFKNHNHGKNRKIVFLLKDILHNISDAITVCTVYKLDKKTGILMCFSLFTEEIFH